jgi:hypothetical protein
MSDTNIDKQDTQIDHKMNLFILKDENNLPIILDDKYTLEFIEKHLEYYPTNLFKLSNSYNVIVHDKFTPEFIEEHLKKYTTNLFELKDAVGPIILYEKFDDNFIRTHIKFVKKEPINKEINIFEIVDRFGTPLIHRKGFTVELIEEQLLNYPVNLFKLKDTSGFPYIYHHKFSRKFIEKHKQFCEDNNI